MKPENYNNYTSFCLLVRIACVWTRGSKSFRLLLLFLVSFELMCDCSISHEKPQITRTSFTEFQCLYSEL
jgi:hypothetical protein